MPGRWRTATTQVQSVAVQACWRPMEGDTAGDFHDVVDLRDGRVAVVVGDAPGFGPTAAAIAEELRAELRRRFAETGDAAAVLSRLDAALARRGDEVIATAACAVVHPGERTVEVVNAGHLPLVVAEGETAELLNGHADPPLGIGVPRGTRQRALRHDSAVFLYTDGLIERRGVALDQSIAGLVAACEGIGGASAWASEFARRATAVFGQPTDDATVVSLRLVPDPARIPAGEPAPRVRDQVTLRVYLDPRDLRSRQLHRVVAEMAHRATAVLDVHVEVVDVTSRSPETEDAGVLAAPTIIRVSPEPPVRVIGWHSSPADLARALQIPLPEENA